MRGRWMNDAVSKQMERTILCFGSEIGIDMALLGSLKWCESSGMIETATGLGCLRHQDLM